VGFVGLALALTITGLRQDKLYPGLRFQVLEIPRRWATLLGAFRGFRHFGWSGRRPPPTGNGPTPPPSASGKP
jgi:hypothetical protein